MENPTKMMLIASLMGTLAGIYYTTAANPLNNYFIFMALFALTGVAAANIVLLILVEIYAWLRNNNSNAKKTQNQQTA